MSSLRWRISLAFAGLAAVVAVAMSVLVYRASVRDRDARVRSVEVQRVQVAATLYASTQRLVGGATLSDVSAPAALRAAVRAGHTASDLVGGGDGPTVWAGAPLAGSGGVFVRASAAEDERALRALRRTLLVVGAAATAGAAALGLAVAGGLSRRLRRAAATARRIGAGELEARVGVGGRDEVGALATAVDAMADALAERIARERRFTADVAHELRTPVTGLVSAAALLPEGDPATAMVRARAARLRALVEDLLEIARLESGQEVAEARAIDLGRLAADVAARYAPGCRAEGEGRVWTDPRRLERILVNLVENAVRHGRPPVRVRVGKGRIEVLDDGPGFDAELLARATERFVARPGGVGTGLGLAIAAEQARVIGAALSLANRPAGGAIVTVLLPGRDKTETDRA